MKPSTLAATLALFAVGTNWHWTNVSEHGTSATITTARGADFVLAVCIATSAALFVRIYKQFRLNPHPVIEIPNPLRCINLRPCLLLLPLFVKLDGSSQSTTAAGIPITRNFGYGSDISAGVFIACALTIVAYQFHHSLAALIASNGKTRPKSPAILAQTNG